MSFTVEDGTGLANANSYGTFAGYVAYWLDRGVVVAELQAVIEPALVRATDYLGIRFRFIGERLTTTQALDWPRQCAYTPEGLLIEGLPVALIKATYEYARRALAGALAPDPTVDASGQTVVSSRKKVGPIEVETAFTGGSSATFKPYPVADRLLRDLICPEGGRVWRA